MKNPLNIAVSSTVSNADYVGNQPIKRYGCKLDGDRVYTKSQLLKLNVFICLFFLGGGVNSKCQLGSINLYNFVDTICMCLCMYVCVLLVYL